MDTLSHGLWGGITVGRRSKKDYWMAFLFGVLPDIIPFGWTFVNLFFGLDHRRFGPPDASSIPSYIYQLYNITHSLIVFALVFVLVWIVRFQVAKHRHQTALPGQGRRFSILFAYLPMLAWAFHILLDIPTHSDRFFPTPMLWPVSNFHIDGIPWSTPWIFFSNWGLLIILYSIGFLKKLQKR